MSTTTNVTPLKLNYMPPRVFDNTSIENENEVYLPSGGGISSVYETGTSSFWTYRKWSNGWAECWGKITVTLSHYTTWGSGYAYHTVQSFPAGLFSGPPTITYSANIGSSFAHTGLSLNLSATQANYYAFSSASGSQSVTFYIIAAGPGWEEKTMSIYIATADHYTENNIDGYIRTWGNDNYTDTFKTINNNSSKTISFTTTDDAKKIISIYYDKYPDITWSISADGKSATASLPGSNYDLDNSHFVYTYAIPCDLWYVPTTW